MSKLKKYMVGFAYEEIGRVVVEAKSAKEAEFILNDRLAMEGISGMDYDCTGREYGAHCSEDTHLQPEIKYGDHIPDEEYEDADGEIVNNGMISVCCGSSVYENKIGDDICMDCQTSCEIMHEGDVAANETDEICTECHDPDCKECE